MRRLKAALGSLLFLLVAPGVVAGLVPWLISHWDLPDGRLAGKVVGGLITAVAVAMLVHAFAKFVWEGLGTPAPVAPTERLVIGGLYRYVRNPMYIAVIATILGQALLFADWGLLLWGVVVALVQAGFVRLYEEPALRKSFGESYETYCREVPAWLPRLHPWNPVA